MINYFNNKAKSTHHKAQISIFFIAIIATLIAITFVTIMIGKTAKDKTYASNAADAGALAGCSIMATGFNYVADKNGRDNTGDLQDATATQEREQAKGRKDITLTQRYGSLKQASVALASPPSITGPNIKASDDQRYSQKGMWKNVKEFLKDVRNFIRQQRKRLNEIGNNSFGSDGKQNNYYDNALSMAYKINFQNSGIHHRLGRLNQKLYSKFIEGIQPGTVQSGQPLTFTWVDGAARVHIVVAIIETEKPNKWNVKTARDNSSQTYQKLAQSLASIGTGLVLNASSGGVFKVSDPLVSIIGDGIGNGLAKLSSWFSGKGDKKAQEAEEGLRNDSQAESRNPRLDLADETPKQIDEIYHSRTVFSFNFQFHMGSPVKGIAGDIDVRGGAKGAGSDPRHECGLIAAF